MSSAYNPIAGYILSLFSVGAGSPADSTTYFIGGDGNNSGETVYANARIEIPKAGTVKYAVLKLRVAGTLGTNEATNHFLRLNDTTDFAQITSTYDAATRDLHATGLSQAVNAGDFLALKIVCPAWVTNPTTVRWRCDAYIE